MIYIIFILLIRFSNIFCQDKLQSFLNKITVNQYSQSIESNVYKNDLIIFNGIDILGYYNGINEKIIYLSNDIIKELSSMKLQIIIQNDDYIILVFIGQYSKLLIWNKSTKQYTWQKYSNIINNCIFISKNTFIFTDIFNSMKCFHVNGQLIWEHEYPYSKIIQNIHHGIIFNKKIYWIFNKNIIYVINPYNGNIEENINFIDIIQNFYLYENYLIVLTKNSIILMNLLSLELIKEYFFHNHGYSLLHQDRFYCHNNYNLIKINLKDLSSEEFLIPNDSLIIGNPLLFNNKIILTTTNGIWFIFNGKNFIIKNQWNIWSRVLPVVYNNVLIYYKNFTNKCWAINNQI